ncbi:alpha/beta fold hydrolase [Ramlibacter rhizophilus]|uniref:Alpha/beta hydrolase n=1 Tax=Ramlibacter rhizophilus TaxID=1781167 RepID=A0A4Z0C244_9BURK|nr:alpha/beta hydrolase [Ramlibacter rhizophilus]TFZ04550.1 alpha/beta hydrolase [Ramlibacter rhizophilus]
MKRVLLFALVGAIVALVFAWHATPALFLHPLLSVNRGLSGLQAHTIGAAGHRVHYLAGGPDGVGTPIVMLHGIFAEKDHWVEFARPLTGTWRVIAPDLPGFGDSGRHAHEPYHYEAQVARLRALLDALQLQRVHLAGSSMGGTLAVLFAQEYPERVASVALIGSPHGLRTPKPSTMDTLIDAGQAPLVAATPEQFDRMMDLLFARQPWIPFPVLQRAMSSAKRDAPSNLRVWHEQLQHRYLLDARIGSLRAPTLALWGEADQVFHPSGMQRLRDHLPGARIEALPGLGHLPMMEAPRDTAEAYARFLRSLPPPAGLSARSARP